MSRTLTAQIKAMSPFERLAFYIGLQKAANNSRVASQKANLRLAARHVYAFLDGPDMDIMLRLQVLEGVATGKVGQGKWWRQGRRGLSQAKDALAGQPVDPSWFSTGNTGMISKVIAMMRAAYKGWSSRYTIIKEVDNLVANLVMGLGAADTPMRQGPIALQVGAKNSGLRKGVLSGSESPTDAAGPIGKLAVKKIGDEVRQHEQSTTTDQLEEGGSVYDYTQSGGADLFSVLADLVSDPRSPIQGLLQKTFERELGAGKWADIAADYTGRTLRGEKIKKGDMAAEYGMAAGTFSKILRTKVKPAIESLKNNRSFREQVMDIAEREMRGRYASPKTANDPHVFKLLRQLEDVSMGLDMLPRTRSISRDTVQKIQTFQKAAFAVSEAVSSDLSVRLAGSRGRLKVR